ncbi:MAG: EutN/CcmL family microcompartment protein [Candidatus Coatesbacteria bacterium]|nr:EutN/CcmL family microcompartment protein [Candidatus Coatesbacteria bacterium]
MILARVIEPIVTTIKYPDLEGEKILMVQAASFDSKSLYGDPFWVIDRIGARQGDWVLVINEGGSVGMILDKGRKNYINGVVAGIIEEGHEYLMDTES